MQGLFEDGDEIDQESMGLYNVNQVDDLSDESNCFYTYHDLKKNFKKDDHYL